MNYIENISKLNKWIENEEFIGWDPFDALNSSMIQKIVNKNRVLGQIFVQVNKKLPFNLREVLRIRKAINPKGLGLFLEASFYLDKLNDFPEQTEQLNKIYHLLLNSSCSNYSGYCWGYNFDWANRDFYAPAGTPTIVNSSIIGLAILTTRSTVPHENKSSIEIVRSICDFILNDLYIYSDHLEEICFSYTPLDKRLIHNANLFGAWLLSEVYTYTHEEKLADMARKATNYSVRRQHADGSWWYGEKAKEHWIDNFHTGYNLIALKHISTNLGLPEIMQNIEIGYKFWKENFIRSDGIPNYMPGKKYPIDIHCISQTIITLLEFADADPEALGAAEKVATWAIENMQDPSGYFYYQKTQLYTNKIPYMRWGQAWMFLALTKLITYQSAR